MGLSNCEDVDYRTERERGTLASLHNGVQQAVGQHVVIARSDCLCNLATLCCCNYRAEATLAVGS